MYDIVECSLCKCTIYVTEGQQSVFGHTSTECYGMSLGYTYVECPFGHLFHHNVHRASTWHGRCHSNYLGVLFCQFKQCMSEYILIFLRLCGVVVHNAFACVWIEFSRCVPCRHILLCRCISVSFLSVKMQQFRSCHILQLTQYAHQFLHVVSVKGTEVLYVHTVEDVLLMRNRTLHRICQSDKSLLAVIIQHAMAIEPSCRLKLYGVICLVGAQVQQILLHTSHTSVYRHIVVVQDDKQVVRAARYVVQSFKCQSAAQCSVANHRHHVSVFLSFQLSCHRHAQSRRYRVAGMSAGKGVVFALFRRWKRLYSA